MTAIGIGEFGENYSLHAMLQSAKIVIDGDSSMIDSLDLEIASLRVDNDRLRGLIRDAEGAASYEDASPTAACPWCDSNMSQGEIEPHGSRRNGSCPAFNFTGDVK